VGMGAVFGGLLFLVLWISSRSSRGRLLIQDGVHCPGCGYNLKGNTSSVCSECGRPFTLEELDLAAQDLQPNSNQS